jgi:hypothetical protein
MSHWDPYMRAVIDASKDRTRARRVEFFTGLDTTVCYLTIKDLARREGVKDKVVRYALAKGYLQAARRQSGPSGVLIHPDEANRWAAERKKRTVQ